MSNTTRNDVKQLAANIENLAKEVQSKLDTNGDFLATANELVLLPLGSLKDNRARRTRRRGKLIPRAQVSRVERSSEVSTIGFARLLIMTTVHTNRI